MFNPAKPSIAVAFIIDSNGRLLLTWNEKWGAFTLPMTKVDMEVPAETPSQAAVRAAAEVLQVPCRVVAGKHPQFSRGLQKSDRDAQIKDYQYNVIQVEPHPDFAAHITSQLLVWAAIDKLQAGEYQPISQSVEPLLRESVEWGWAS
jgi:ADP-ribose pyrophosphatase YjhB (NUDIX family)